MLSPVVYRTTRSTIVVSLAAVFFLVLLPVMAMAQEAYLVTAADGSLAPTIWPPTTCSKPQLPGWEKAA